MKVLILSWEYPPRSIGGVSTHVYNLSQSLKKSGSDVWVVTCGNDNSLSMQDDSGVQVCRVTPLAIATDNFVEWVNHLNYAMIEQCNKLVAAGQKFDVIHVHDWLTAYAGKVISDSYSIPIITTIHSTEYGRNNGIHTELQRYIHSVEDYIIARSNKVICCSEYMKEHIATIFNYNKDCITVVPNGVNKPISDKVDLSQFRHNYAEDNERIIFFIGRHVYEKGIHLIIEAAPEVLKTYENIKFIFAGTGPMTEELKQRAYMKGVSDKIKFIGYIEEDVKANLYKCSDATIIPSLYEPFGIVALEAMANYSPVIAADCGGLKELVENGTNGLLFTSGSEADLADKIIHLLSNDKLKSNLVAKGITTVEDNYNWIKVAEVTSLIYSEFLPKKRKNTTKKASKKSESKDATQEEKVVENKTKKTTKKNAIKVKNEI